MSSIVGNTDISRLCLALGTSPVLVEIVVRTPLLAVFLSVMVASGIAAPVESDE